MDERQLAGLLALGDTFGALGAVGSGRPYRSQALPVAIRLRREEQAEARKQAEDDRVRGLLGIPDVDTPQGANGTPPQGLLAGMDPRQQAAVGALAQVNPQAALRMATESAFAPASKPPSSVQEYQFALGQGFQGGFQDWITAKAQAGRAQGAVETFRPATAKEAAAYGADAGQINTTTKRFHASPRRKPDGGSSRQMKQDTTGRWRFVDDGSLVFPDVTANADPMDELERRKLAAEVDKLENPPPPGPDVDGEGKLRKEFTGISSDFRSVRDAYTRIESSAKDPSAAGDLALIFNYMKVLDPGSVVRESEFATAANSAGVPDRVRALYNKVLSGERLAEEQRADFLKRGRDLFEGRRVQYEKTEEEYRRLAEAYGFDPSRIVPDLNLAGEVGGLDPSRADSTRQIGGKTYYQIDGRWYVQ